MASKLLISAHPTSANAMAHAVVSVAFGGGIAPVAALAVGGGAMYAYRRYFNGDDGKRSTLIALVTPLPYAKGGTSGSLLQRLNMAIDLVERKVYKDGPSELLGVVGETFGNVVRASAETLDVAVETISSTAVIPTFAIDKDVALDDIKTFDGFCEQLGGWVDMLSTKDRKVFLFDRCTDTNSNAALFLTFVMYITPGGLKAVGIAYGEGNVPFNEMIDRATNATTHRVDALLRVRQAAQGD